MAVISPNQSPSIRCKTTWIRATLLATLLFLTGCATQSAHKDGKAGTDRTEVMPVTADIAKEITHATSGTILTTDPIRIQFAHQHVTADQTDTPLQSESPVFRLTPWVEGEVRWDKDGRTLEFRPEQPLPRNTRFSCSVDLNALFGRTEDKLEPGIFQFQFQTGRQEINMVSGSFEPHPDGKPDMAVYNGTISLTEPADLQIVKQATTITLDREPVDAIWSVREDLRQFTFHIPDIRRDNRKHELTISVDGKPLKAVQSKGHRSSLYPLNKLSLIRIRSRTEQDTRTAVLEFSDRLDPSQNLEGFVRVQPEIPFSIQKKHKEVVLIGAFVAGQQYRIHVEPGIRSVWGNETREPRDRDIRFSFLKPVIRFASDGLFLPTSNNRRIRFEATNVKSVKVEILRIFESNLGQYLQRANLENTRERNDGFYESDRVAVKVAEKQLDLEIQANQRQIYDIDLTGLVPEGLPGLFLVHLSFEKDSMIFDNSEPEGGYYEDPRRPGYLWRHGNIYKAVLLSDIGLSYQQAGSDHVVCATDLVTGKPLKNVEITLNTYQNQVIGKKRTDSNGIARFAGISETVFFARAEKNGMISVVLRGAMAWNTSTFDTGGQDIRSTGIRAFIYPDRGVHRPGDTVYLSVIARNDSGSFPDDHPISLKLTNPRGQVFLEKTTVAAKDGFASFTFSTPEDAPTGTWSASVTVGDSTFNHPLPIETVVPYRLKLSLNTDQPVITSQDKQWKAHLHADYLFGSPAAGLTASAEIRLSPARPPAKGYAGFVFHDESVRYKSRTIPVYSGTLDSKGDATLNWTVPKLDASPGMLEGQLTATVLEKGGRPNRSEMRVPIHPYNRYVGIQPPRFKWGYAAVGKPVESSIIVVDTEGNPVSGQPVQWKLYHNERNWWYEYRSWSDFKQKYRDDFNTTVVREGSLASGAIPVSFVVQPEKRGSYLLEVRNGDGHTASFFFDAYAWGDATSPDSAATMPLEMDRNRYEPGDTATLSFPTPAEGTILVSVVKGHRILSAFRSDPSGEERTEIRLPVTREMIPNAYVAISVIQPHDVTSNDRPIRMFGVRSIPVSDPSTQLGVQIDMPDELESGKPFRIDIRTTDGKPARFTISVVDEGLLALTRFQTPDPWKHFFAKERLVASLSDLYDHVINAMKGDPFHVFSIGGDAARLAREGGPKPKEDGKRRRFKPVALFKGPIETDDTGHASVSFTMPRYIGAVRTMVVAARQDTYGSADKTVPVKQDLMLLPTLPRVLHPGDHIVIPVTVFSMRDGLGDVRITVHTEGPVTADLPRGDLVSLAQAGETDIPINLSVNQALGQARISIRAKAQSAQTNTDTDIHIVPVSPEITEWDTQPIKPGESITVNIPDHGLPGSNHVKIRVTRRAGLNITHRLERLIRYPYGCLEQTTSAALPQLYLKHLATLSRDQERAVDAHINEAIDRLRRFQVPAGGFSYWPGNNEPNYWCTSYAGRFLLEADRAGYYVPDELKQRWLAFEQQAARAAAGSLTTRCYRVYLLARAGKPEMGAMNLLKENSMKNLSGTNRWLLAAAYDLSGSPDIATDMLRNEKLEISEYRETGGTYGSAFRDRAIALEASTAMKQWDLATDLFEQVADRLSGKSWLSTQEAGYGLAALGHYILITEKNDTVLTGTFQLENGKRVPFHTESLMTSLKVPDDAGKKAVVTLDPSCPVETARLTVEWTGIPIRSDIVTESHHGIRVFVRWLDENGKEIDPERLPQGTVFYAHYRIQLDRALGTIEEVVLNQMLPSVWEVENTRMTGGGMPDWARTYPSGRVDYVDVRDDRISWFFDLYARRSGDYHLIQKLRTVTVGTSQLPPTVCEAMYDNRYRSVIPGRTVTVTPAR